MTEIIEVVLMVVVVSCLSVGFIWLASKMALDFPWPRWLSIPPDVTKGMANAFRGLGLAAVVFFLVFYLFGQSWGYSLVAGSIAFLLHGRLLLAARRLQRGVRNRKRRDERNRRRRAEAKAATDSEKTETHE